MKKKKRARADKNYKFTERRHSGPAAAAFIISFVPLALFFYAAAVSYATGGQAPQKVGCVGVAAMIVAVLTLDISIREARKEKVIKKVPVAGACMSVLMLAGWTAVYVLGWIGA